ncbi:MAG: hypothetical protein K6B44_10840 [Lachnospiraceae bacterium]|nr:hypothetical protein [Lachnospiraceae bacterium]
MLGVIKKALLYAAALMAALVLFPLSVNAAPELMPDGQYFDAEYYAEHNPDVKKVCGTSKERLYAHYIEFGKTEGRDPFDPELLNDPDFAAMPGVDLSPIAAADAFTLKGYFSRSVFIGDSIMAGYHNHLAYLKDANLSGAQFLAKVSYSAVHANNENDRLHPAYLGKSQPVWDSISMMPVDRAFIMFGTNDLVSFSPEQTVERVTMVADKIKLKNPAVDIDIISMTPVYPGTNKGFLSNPFIAQYNQLMSVRCAERGWGFVNINQAMTDANGDLRVDYSSDKYVHLTNKAYSEVWDLALQNFALNQIGERARVEVRGPALQ